MTDTALQPLSSPPVPSAFAAAEEEDEADTAEPKMMLSENHLEDPALVGDRSVHCLFFSESGAKPLIFTVSWIFMVVHGLHWGSLPLRGQESSRACETTTCWPSLAASSR